MLGSLNKSCGALLLAPRVKPRWWSKSGSAGFPYGSAAPREKFLGRGRKPTNSDEVARALELVPRHWQKCRCRLAPNRSAGSPCLEVGRTGVRGATEYISGRGFVITALPVLATNHRQRCHGVCSPNKRDEASDRPAECRSVHDVIQDRTRRVSRSRLRGFASVVHARLGARANQRARAARNASVRGFVGSSVKG